MNGLVLRGGAAVVAILAASVAYYLSAGLAIALSIAVAGVMLAAAFVATPVSLDAGASNRQSFVLPILLATSLALGAIGAAISETPIMVVTFVLGADGARRPAGSQRRDLRFVTPTAP